MPTLTLANCTLHYQDIPAKNNSEDIMVLLHANPGDSQDYKAVIDKLSEKKRLIAIDWPGYGGASSFNKPLQQLGKISPILFYDILLEALDALNITSADFIGNSIGGNVAARLAALHPEKVKSLILVSPGGFTKHNPFTKAFCQFQGSKLGLSAANFARLYLRERTPIVKSMLARAKTGQASSEAIKLNRAMWQSFKTQDNNLLELAKNITAPTTLIFGQFDPIIPALTDGRAAKKCIPHAHMHVFACGHVAFAEVPEKFLEAIS